MERRSGFITFLVSLVPGAGYMYFGLLKKGLEAMVLFFLIPTILRYVGMNFITPVFCVPFWLYTFFNTYHIAHKVDRGEVLEDESWFAKDSFGFSSGNVINNNFFKIVAWGLIIIGILAIANRIFVQFQVLYIVRSYIVPVVFVIVGLYLLLRDKNKLN